MSHSAPAARSGRIVLDGAEITLRTDGGSRRLRVPASIKGFDGPTVATDQGIMRLVEPSTAAATRLRELVPELRPLPLGPTGTSFGFGDRLGNATPGHIAALRACDSTIKPVLAQQSARELARTGRSFADVLAATTWGVLEAGWTDTFGADADHLSTERDVRDALDAGFTMITLDPSAHIDASADRSQGADLERRLRGLPWRLLEDDWTSLRRRYATDEAALASTAATFGHAVARVLELWRTARAAASNALDVEVSVDETGRPTSALGHRYIARELRRLGVAVTGLAPRFPGTWQKGVELDADRDALERALDQHMAIASEEGGHKVSIHSGSDKFTLYPLLAARRSEAWHVKTSGTSYLEALRVVALHQPALFREVLACARKHLDDDRRTYDIAANARVPDDAVDADLPGSLDVPSVRQALHVTFGSVLRDVRVGPALRAAVAQHADDYAIALRAHLGRHLSLLGAA